MYTTVVIHTHCIVFVSVLACCVKQYHHESRICLRCNIETSLKRSPAQNISCIVAPFFYHQSVVIHHLVSDRLFSLKKNLHNIRFLFMVFNSTFNNISYIVESIILNKKQDHWLMEVWCIYKMSLSSVKSKWVTRYESYYSHIVLSYKPRPRLVEMWFYSKKSLKISKE